MIKKATEIHEKKSFPEEEDFLLKLGAQKLQSFLFTIILSPMIFIFNPLKLCLVYVPPALTLRKLCNLPTECTYVFFVILRIN
jgi:hypothetical protein